MSPENEFVAYLLELLEPFGGVEAKPMFGGFGIYRHGLMFGLVSQDTLYLKVDDKTRPAFEARGLIPFTYNRQGKELVMSYYQAPPDAMDNSQELSRWARNAYDTAVRAVRGRTRKKRVKGVRK